MDLDSSGYLADKTVDVGKIALVIYLKGGFEVTILTCLNNTISVENIEKLLDCLNI